MEGSRQVVHGILGGIAREGHNLVFDGEGVADLAEDEALFLGRCLDIDVAEIEHGRDETAHLARDVLDALETQFANITGEESFLFDIDDALVGDDPDVEVVVDPNEETVEPQKKEKRVLGKEEKGQEVGVDTVRKHEGDDRETADQEKNEQEDNAELNEDVEPVAMGDAQHLFVLVLALEMETTEGLWGWHSKRDLARKGGREEGVEWQGKKDSGVGEDEHREDSQKKDCAHDRHLAIE